MQTEMGNVTDHVTGLVTDHEGQGENWQVVMETYEIGMAAEEVAGKAIEVAGKSRAKMVRPDQMNHTGEETHPQIVDLGVAEGTKLEEMSAATVVARIHVMEV